MRKIMTDKKDNTENGFKDFYFGNNVFNLDTHKAKKKQNPVSEDMDHLYKLIKGLNEGCVFNLKEGIIEEILLGNDDHEKVKFITYLLGEVFTHDLIKDEIKLQCMGAFTYGLNVIIHGDLGGDEVSES